MNSVLTLVVIKLARAKMCHSISDTSLILEAGVQFQFWCFSFFAIHSILCWLGPLHQTRFVHFSFSTFEQKHFLPLYSHFYCIFDRVRPENWRSQNKFPSRLGYGKWTGLMSTLRKCIRWNISWGNEKNHFFSKRSFFLGDYDYSILWSVVVPLAMFSKIK